jgi:hypothetical protein
LLAFGYAARMAPSSSSRWQPSLKTFVGSPSSWFGHHQQSPRASHSRCGYRCHRVKAAAPTEQAQASSFKKSLQPPQFLQSQTSATKSANSGLIHRSKKIVIRSLVA